MSLICRPLQRLLLSFSPFPSPLPCSSSPLPCSSLTASRSTTDAALSSTSAEIEPAYGFDSAEFSTAKPFTCIPGPRSVPFFGSTFAYRPFGDLDPFDAMARGTAFENRYGKIIRTHVPWIGMKNIVTLLDPADCEIVYRNEGKIPYRPPYSVLKIYREEKKQSLGLFLSNDSHWWRLRQPLNKTMMRANAAYPYLEIQSPVGDELVEKIGREAEKWNGRYPEVMEVMNRWALESVCAVVFDRRLGCMDPNLPKDAWQQKFIDTVLGATQNVTSLSLDPTVRMAKSLGYKTKRWKLMEEQMSYIDSATIDLIQETKTRLEANPDAEGNSKRFLPQLLAVEGFSTEDKISVIFDIIMASIATTTYSLSRLLFLLAKHPDKQEKLLIELNAEVGSPGSPITPTTLSKLDYLKACIRESQRMMPIVPQNVRTLPIEVVIKGYRIPKGTQILVEHEYISKSPENFEDPLRFIPERWLRTQGKRETRFNPFMVLPFGFGPRMCIGRRFAEQELYIGIIKMVHSFKIGYEGNKLPLVTPGLDRLPIKLDFVFEKRQVNN